MNRVIPAELLDHRMSGPLPRQAVDSRMCRNADRSRADYNTQPASINPTTTTFPLREAKLQQPDRHPEATINDSIMPASEGLTVVAEVGMRMVAPNLFSNGRPKLSGCTSAAACHLCDPPHMLPSLCVPADDPSQTAHSHISTFLSTPAPRHIFPILAPLSEPSYRISNGSNCVPTAASRFGHSRPSEHGPMHPQSKCNAHTMFSYDVARMLELMICDRPSR